MDESRTMGVINVLQELRHQVRILLIFALELGWKKTTNELAKSFTLLSVGVKLFE